MSGKHTPGPWEVRYLDEVYAGNTNIADAWSYDGVRDSERLANARLIAAAPDLLEALEQLIAPYEEGRDDNWDGKREERRSFARQAIAKATGEE